MKFTSYRKLRDGSHFDTAMEEATAAALDRQHHVNRSYLGTPYPYYVLDEQGEERRADIIQATHED